MLDERCTPQSTSPEEITSYQNHPVTLTCGVDPGQIDTVSAANAMTVTELPRQTFSEVVQQCDPDLDESLYVLQSTMRDKLGLELLQQAVHVARDARGELLEKYEITAEEESGDGEVDEEKRGSASSNQSAPPCATMREIIP